MNKKLLAIPALVLSLGIASIGLSTKVSAATLGFGLQLGNGSAGAHVQASGEMGGMHGTPGVFGTVTAVNGTNLTVQSKGWGQNATTTSYTVDASNASVTKANATSSVSAIAVGDTVMVQGTVSGSSVTATKINDGVMPQGGGRGVFGTVTAVNGDTLTVQSKAMGQNTTATSYTVNASGATVTKAGSTSSVSAIAVGDTVMIQGTVNGTSVTATRINDGVMARGGTTTGSATAGLNSNGQPIIGGTVTAVSGDTVTITGKDNQTYTIDATNATVTKAGASSSVSSIAVGDQVLAQGTINGNSVTAVNVVDGTSTSSSTAHKGFLGAIGAFFAKIF